MSPKQETMEAAAETQRWSVVASVGSILSAFIASLCCVGPLAFALLGIGGAGLLVKFEPYRPYFTAATFALLGAGFYFTYRKPASGGRTTQSSECACPAPKTSRVGKVALWISTVLVAAFLGFPYIAPFIFG